MSTGIKPATGRVPCHPWIDPGQSQIRSCTIHVCLSARSAALLGGATCHGPEHLVRSCWLCIECKALAVLESGELGEIMSLSRKRVVLPLAINREVFLGCTHSLWVCSILLAHRCRPHRTWETKETDTDTILPFLVPGVSCLLQHPWDGSRQMCKFVRRLTSQTLPFSCTTLQPHWPLPFCSSGTQLIPVFRILFFLFPSCEMLSQAQGLHVASSDFSPASGHLSSPEQGLPSLSNQKSLYPITHFIVFFTVFTISRYLSVVCLMPIFPPLKCK